MTSPGEFYDAMSPVYDEAILRCVPRYREMQRAILDYVPDDLAPQRILDLGIGSGNLARLVLDRWPDAEVIGVDVSGEMLATCRRNLASERLTLLERDFRKLDLDDGSVDLVVSSIAIHHVNDDDKQVLFRNLARIVRPGGAVAYSDQFRGATEEIYAKHLAQWRTESFALGASEEEWQTWMDHQDDHDHHAPLVDQVRWLEAAGFRDVDCPWRFLLWTVLVARRP